MLKSLNYTRENCINTTEFFYKVANKDHVDKGFETIDDLIREKSEACFVNITEYHKNDKTKILIECSGTVLYKYKKPFIVIGTHVILK